MTASEGGAPKATRILTYVLTFAVIGALVIWGVAVFHAHTTGAQADTKATQLKKRLERAGLPAPDTRSIADALGTNGGLVCENPSSPLVKARYQAAISNGAAGPGGRPVIGDTDVTEAVSLAIATYCPDKLGDWIKQVRGLKLEDTT